MTVVCRTVNPEADDDSHSRDRNDDANRFAIAGIREVGMRRTGRAKAETEDDRDDNQTSNRIKHPNVFPQYRDEGNRENATRYAKAHPFQASYDPSALRNVTSVELTKVPGRLNADHEHSQRKSQNIARRSHMEGPDTDE